MQVADAAVAQGLQLGAGGVAAEARGGGQTRTAGGLGARGSAGGVQLEAAVAERGARGGAVQEQLAGGDGQSLDGGRGGGDPGHLGGGEAAVVVEADAVDVPIEARGAGGGQGAAVQRRADPAERRGQHGVRGAGGEGAGGQCRLGAAQDEVRVAEQELVAHDRFELYARPGEGGGLGAGLGVHPDRLPVGDEPAVVEGELRGGLVGGDVRAEGAVGEVDQAHRGLAVQHVDDRQAGDRAAGAVEDGPGARGETGDGSVGGDRAVGGAQDVQGAGGVQSQHAPADGGPVGLVGGEGDGGGRPGGAVPLHDLLPVAGGHDVGAARQVVGAGVGGRDCVGVVHRGDRGGPRPVLEAGRPGPRVVDGHALLRDESYRADRFARRHSGLRGCGQHGAGQRHHPADGRVDESS